MKALCRRAEAELGMECCQGCIDDCMKVLPRRFEELRGGEDEHSSGNVGGGAEEKGMTNKGERGDRDLTHRPTFAASCSADSRCSCVDGYSRTQE